MIVAVLADEVLKKELLANKTAGDINFIWADSLRSLLIIEADVYIDLLFDMDAERIDRLKQLLPRPVLVNAVPWSTKTIGAGFIRINAWPTLLQRPVTEVALPATMQEATVQEIFTQLQWKYQLVPDIPGMITPRVLAAIINEAYYTLGAEVSTKPEIDTAMKLGTSYPYGPFEWSEKIGLAHIYRLLKELSSKDERYAIAPLLREEAEVGGRK
jgi:3-hydroxybutyryl-CoA dehydrogenase